MNKCDQFKVYIFIFLFTLLFVGEFLINQLTHSVLILVDSYYNLFQICTLIFILLDQKTSQEKSIRATFGWARLSVLGTLICHTFFGALAFALIVESLQLILHTSHENTTLRPNLNLFAAILSIFVQLLSCSLIMRLLNKETNNFSISGPNLQMHFVVRSAGDQLEHVTVTDQQANQMILTAENRKEANQNDQRSNEPKNNKKLNSIIDIISINNEKCESKNNPLNTSLDGSQLKQQNQKIINQQHLTLRILRNFISGTFLILNSIIVYILLKSKQFETETVDNALKYLDPTVAIISVILLCCLVYPEVKTSGLILLQSLPSYIEIDKLKRKLIKKFPMIFECHELHIWCLNTQKVIATCHIKLKHHFKSNEQFALFLNEVQLFFKQEGIDQATIQPEFICSNALNSNGSSCTLNDENEDAFLRRVPSCLLKCKNRIDECEKNVCCHPKDTKGECERKTDN